ncbi:MAG: ferredoxin, partial [Clostridia bacterium]|nr:ferredoxin [Clostridia bacterium]
EPMKNALNVNEYDEEFFHLHHEPDVKDIFRLDEDFGLALKKMRDIEVIYSTLPQLDCGQCGAPSCRAFAEDVVLGETTIEKCQQLRNETK